LDYSFLFALKEKDYLLYDLSVFLFADDSDTGPEAMVDVIVKAGSQVTASDSSGAGTKWEDSFQHFQGLSQRLGAGKRTEIVPAILFQTPGSIYPGPIFVEVNLEVRKSLIIFKSDVVMGTESLYQVTFKDEGLLFRIGNKEVKVIDPGYHPLQFWW